MTNKPAAKKPAAKKKLCESLTIRVGDVAAALLELDQFLESEAQFREVSIERNAARVLALFGGDRAWLMFMREPGDPGLSTRNPSLGEHDDATLPFMMSNGQLDRYPEHWTYPSDAIHRALGQFVSTARFPDDLSWHDDGGEGRVSPNDTAFAR